MDEEIDDFRFSDLFCMHSLFATLMIWKYMLVWSLRISSLSFTLTQKRKYRLMFLENSFGRIIESIEEYIGKNEPKFHHTKKLTFEEKVCFLNLYKRNNN